MKERVRVLGALVLLVAAAAWARVGTPVQQAPPRVNTLRNPFEGQQRAQRAGSKLFARECAACHGPDGMGMGKPPPLNPADVHHGPPGGLFSALRNASTQRA